MGSARDLPGRPLSSLRLRAIHLLERWVRSALPLWEGQITMPEDLVSCMPLRVESDPRRATGVFTSDSFQMNERHEQHTMPDHKKENAMSTTTGVQPRTFSWLTDGFRDLLSFQKTPSNDRDKPVSVSDATQPILETGPASTKARRVMLTRGLANAQQVSACPRGSKQQSVKISGRRPGCCCHRHNFSCHSRRAARSGRPCRSSAIGRGSEPIQLLHRKEGSF